jgi:hypothetical protein
MKGLSPLKEYFSNFPDQLSVHAALPVLPQITWDTVLKLELASI